MEKRKSCGLAGVVLDLLFSVMAMAVDLISSIEVKMERRKSCGLAGVVLDLLFSIMAMAVEKFVVEKNSLGVTSPDSVKGTYDSAIGNFGIPHYGGTIVGIVNYPKDNRNGCKRFNTFIVFCSSPVPGDFPLSSSSIVEKIRFWPENNMKEMVPLSSTISAELKFLNPFVLFDEFSGFKTTTYMLEGERGFADVEHEEEQEQEVQQEDHGANQEEKQEDRQRPDSD